MKMVFSTKMKETGKPNNMYYNNYVKPVVKPAVFYKISLDNRGRQSDVGETYGGDRRLKPYNMFENLKSSAECSDCKKTKPNLIK